MHLHGGDRQHRLVSRCRRSRQARPRAGRRGRRGRARITGNDPRVGRLGPARRRRGAAGTGTRARLRRRAITRHAARTGRASARRSGAGPRSPGQARRRGSPRPAMDAYPASCRSGGTRSATIAWSAPMPIEPPMPASRDQRETEQTLSADEDVREENRGRAGSSRGGSAAGGRRSRTACPPRYPAAKLATARDEERDAELPRGRTELVDRPDADERRSRPRSAVEPTNVTAITGLSARSTSSPQTRRKSRAKSLTAPRRPEPSAVAATLAGVSPRGARAHLPPGRSAIDVSSPGSRSRSSVEAPGRPRPAPILVGIDSSATHTAPRSTASATRSSSRPCSC